MVNQLELRPFDVAAFLATVNPGRSVSKYPKDHIIFSEGDPCDAVFYVQEGKIKITVTSEQGKEAILSILEAGEFFGEGCLIGEPTRHLAATSLVVSAVMRIEKAEMIRVLHDQSSFAEKFTAHLLTRKARIEGDLADQLFNSSEKRLARTLLLLANFGKDNRPEQISIKVSQETLAEMVGTTRPRIDHFMNKFRKLGFIDYNGDMHVHRSLLNVLLRD